MVELLVRSKNNTHVDPVKDERGCWKKGDLVVAMPDGHTWGRMESKAQWIAEGNDGDDWPGGFVILKISGLTLAKAKTYIRSHLDDITGETLRRSLFRLVWSELPQGVKDTLIADAEYTATLSQVKQFIRNKIDETEIS